MATRRQRIPMVGDTPVVVVPVDQPKLEVHLRATTVLREVSSSEEAKEFDWEAYSGLLIAALIVPKTVDDLVDYWKANINMLDWAQKIKPDVFERIRTAFSARKKQLQGGRDG